MKIIILLNAIWLYMPLISFCQADYILKEDFDNNKNGWYIASNNGCWKECSINNGEYILDHIIEPWCCWSVINKQLFSEDNFTISTKMKHINGIDNNGFGVMVNYDNKDVNNDYLLCFQISANGNYAFQEKYNNIWTNIIPWTYSVAINQGNAENSLKVVKHDSKYYFYINDILVDRAPFSPLKGSKVGIVVNSEQRIGIDYFYITLNTGKEFNPYATSEIIKSTENAVIPMKKSDVDENIPVNKTNENNVYALIIGNEDYSSFQTGLNTEVNVDYAMNDAKIFKEYCNKTIGIPEKQIKLLTNATSGQMNQGIAWLNNLAKVDNGKAEIIFYYSGHGLPDEQTKESYLIPVDISGSNVTQGVKLTDVYDKLNEHPSQKVTVFLDACFSGGARNQGLIAMKGVKIKPKEDIVKGNMVVFASSTGDESSGVYRENQHGYMTYFLLKKLQESKGNITYKELAEYIIENVKKETALNGKTQTPQLNYSQNIEGIWTNWIVKH